MPWIYLLVNYHVYSYLDKICFCFVSTSPGIGMWDLCTYSSVHDTYNTGKTQCSGSMSIIIGQKSSSLALNEGHRSQK